MNFLLQQIRKNATLGLVAGVVGALLGYAIVRDVVSVSEVLLASLVVACWILWWTRLRSKK